MTDRLLDIENIGRIGQMFISGDLLRDVLIDPLTCDEDDTDYNIPVFNELKKTLSKIERLNPDLFLAGVLWQRYPANDRMAAPAVVGRRLPAVGWGGWVITDCTPKMAESIKNDVNTSFTHDDGRATYYFPIKTSAGDIAGVLELTEGWDRGPYEKIFTD